MPDIDADQTTRTSDEARSTSSTETDTSDAGDGQSIRELGEKILAELNEENTNDTLTRWIIHHAAELTTQADDAAAEGRADADRLAREAKEAILQLWEHRSGWPDGWPPPRAAEMARLLDSVPADRPTLWHGDNVLRRLHHVHLLVLSTLIDLGAIDIESNEEEWLVAFDEYLTNDEVEMLHRAVEANTRFARWQAGLTEAADDERHPLVQLADTYREAVLAVVARTSRGEEPPAE